MSPIQFGASVGSGFVPVVPVSGFSFLVIYEPFVVSIFREFVFVESGVASSGALIKSVFGGSRCLHFNWAISQQLYVFSLSCSFSVALLFFSIRISSSLTCCCNWSLSIPLLSYHLFLVLLLYYCAFEV